ncbi:MAG TPA: VTT domain-containing protein [Anaerolineae bacterium]
MNKDAELVAPQTDKPIAQKRSQAGRLLMLLLAVGISIALIVLTSQYREQIQNLGQAGLLGLFVISIIGNATLIIPAPVFVVACAAGLAFGPIPVGIIAGTGAAIGELTGYLAGYGGQAILPQGRFYNWLRGFMQRHGMLTIFLLGAIPNPIFDVGGLIAGIIRMPVWKYLLAAAVGKSIRLGVTAWACVSGIPWLQQIFK